MKASRSKYVFQGIIALLCAIQSYIVYKDVFSGGIIYAPPPFVFVAIVIILTQTAYVIHFLHKLYRREATSRRVTYVATFSVILLTFLLAIPHFLRAKKMSAATRTLEDLKPKKNKGQGAAEPKKD